MTLPIALLEAVKSEVTLTGADLSLDEIHRLAQAIDEEGIEPGDIGIMLAVKGYCLGRRLGPMRGFLR